ncbi:hypothetical protein JCM10450v2_008131 [Rhodotorula kratochvilovae]
MAEGTPLGQRLSFEWKVDGIKGHLARAQEAETKATYLMSPKFSGWSIKLALLAYRMQKRENASEGYCGVYLYAHSTEQELRKAGGNAAEHGGVDHSLDFVYPAGRRLNRLKCTDKRIFDDGHGWGWKEGLKWSLIDALPDNQDSLIIRCALESGQCFERPQATALPSALYDNPLFADVAFRLTSTEPETTLFAAEPFLLETSTYFATLFGSGFSETTSTVRLDARKKYSAPDDPGAGDHPDFQPFFRNEDDASSVGDDEPMVDQTEDKNGSLSHGPDAAAARPAGEQGAVEAEPRQYHEIKVGDCSYWTFNAFLFHLHYSKVAFLKPISQYVAVTKDPSEKGALAWMEGEVDEAGGAMCSPHALYRLADRYLHDELKKLSKDQILYNLTIASAAYEAFSALGRDYTDISDGVVAFILQHWSAVKSTPGRGRCMELLDAGALPGGAAVLSKILDGLVAKTN